MQSELDGGLGWAGLDYVSAIIIFGPDRIGHECVVLLVACFA